LEVAAATTPKAHACLGKILPLIISFLRNPRRALQGSALAVLLIDIALLPLGFFAGCRRGAVDGELTVVLQQIEFRTHAPRENADNGNYYPLLRFLVYL
jgi:hypothetical protein